MNKLNYSDESIICSSIVDKSHSNNYDHDTNQCIGPGHLVDELAQLGDMRSTSSTSGKKCKTGVSSHVIKRCKLNPLTKSIKNYRHFILNSNRVITASEVYSAALRFFDNKEFKVKRIVKPLFNYIRLSINASLSNDIIRHGVDKTAEILNAVTREQSLKRNLALESVSKSEKSDISSVMTFNINGIKSKYEELLVLLGRFRPDIICLQETKRMESDKGLHLNGYSVFEVPASSTCLGLVLGIRKDSGLSFEIAEYDSDMIIANVKGRNTVTIGNIYRSPNPSKRSEVILKVTNLLRKYPNCLLVGDWNDTPAIIKRKLLKKGVEVDISTAPLKGTRVGLNRLRTIRPIDFGLSNNSQLIVAHKARRGWPISDHLPVSVDVRLSHGSCDETNVTIFDRKRLYEPKVVKAIKSHQYGDNIESFHLGMNEILRKLKIIREEKKRKDSYYLPISVKRAIASKRHIEKQVRKGLSTLDNLHQARLAIRKQVVFHKRKSYMRFIKRGINYLKSNDSKNCWKWIKSHSGLNGKRLSANQVYKPGTNITEDDPKKKLSIWAEHFRKLSLRGPESPSNNVITDTVISNITDDVISWTEVSTVLKSMRKGKAAGLDKIPGEVYKLVEMEISPTSNLAKSILNVLNKAYEGNVFPNEWKDCVVVPVFKKGDKYDPNNYRGIALINTLLKVLTKVLAARLQIVCSTHNLIRREQAGFIKNEECTAQAACLLECCQRRRAKEEDTLLCFLDLKKAYDLVPHDKLISKLYKAGLGNKMISFIKRMYENTFMRVRVGDSVSESFKYERGVRQGCPTSPLLFNLYINDILDDINPVPIPGLELGLRGLMFADDTVIIADSRHDLVSKLESIKQWMIDNAMEVNPSKCGIMSIPIGTINSTNIEPVLYNGEVIPIVDKYVYLGVEFNNKLDMEEMSKHRLDKGKQALGRVVKTLVNPNVPLGYRLMLIKSIIIPTLHYGAEIFGMCEKRVNALKRILDNSIKCIVKRSNFCRMRAYEEFDILPLYVSAAVSRARGLRKWRDSNCLISDLIGSQFKSKKSTWIKEARKWLKVLKIDLEQSISQIKEQIISIKLNKLLTRNQSVIGEWANRLSLTSGVSIRKGEIDSAYSSIGFNAITRIRTGTFTFTNQLVRIGKLPTRFRNSCVCCGSSTTEDVKHMIIECVAFQDVREKYLPSFESGTDDSTIYKYISQLLGGERPSFGRRIYGEVLALSRYLSVVVPRRCGIIAQCSRDS